MDKEYGRERRISILDIKRNSFTVELPKIWVTGVIDKHKLANLFTVLSIFGPNERQITHVWKETDKEII